MSQPEKNYEAALTVDQRHVTTGTEFFGVRGKLCVAQTWAYTDMAGGCAEVALCVNQKQSDGSNHVDIELTPGQARSVAEMLLKAADVAEQLQVQAAAAVSGAPEGVVLQ